MVESGYYPAGAEYDSKAPWNKKKSTEKEIEVCISVTLSKTVKVKVDDYIITDSGIDEDGNYYEDIDYSECNLKEAVENQITLPQDAYNFVVNHKARKDLENWNIDDMEVILENKI